MQQARSSLPHLGDDGRQDSATADKVAEIEECLPTYQRTYVPTHRTLATQQVARNSQPASERCRATLSKQERRIRFACAAGVGNDKAVNGTGGKAQMEANARHREADDDKQAVEWMGD